MHTLATRLALQKDKDDRSNQWNKVQWEIHDIANDSLGREFLKWRANHLSQLGHGIARVARFNLATGGEHARLIAGHEHCVKDIDEGILNKKVFRQKRDDG